MLHLAADHLEVPGLIIRHGTHIRAVKHDDGPARVGYHSLARPVLGSHDLCCRLPVGRLEPQGDSVGANAHALVVRT